MAGGNGWFTREISLVFSCRGVGNMEQAFSHAFFGNPKFIEILPGPTEKPGVGWVNRICFTVELGKIRSMFYEKCWVSKAHHDPSLVPEGFSLLQINSD